jgi:hypothetical protein
MHKRKNAGTKFSVRETKISVLAGKGCCRQAIRMIDKEKKP